MSLYYLSGDKSQDQLGRSRRRESRRNESRNPSKRKEERKRERTTKRSDRMDDRAQKKSDRKENRSIKRENKSEKKEMRKSRIQTRKSQGRTRTVEKGKLKGKMKGFVKKRVAKVGLAPARAAFLTVVTLNGLKVATKLVRIWKKEGGKQKLIKFWEKFGGDADKLKQAMIKGSKEQISGDQIGFAVGAALATAAPIIIALVPLIKEFQAGGSPAEMSEFDGGIAQAKLDLASGNVDGVELGEAAMHVNSQTGVVAKAGASEETGASDEDKTVGAFFTPFALLLFFSQVANYIGSNSPLWFLCAILSAYVSILIPVSMIVETNLFGLSKYLKFYIYPSTLILKFNSKYGKKSTC